MNNLKKIAAALAVLAVIGGAGYYFYHFKEPVNDLISRVENRIAPCQKPITYTIGTFDERFGIKKSEFSDAINQAVLAWNEPSGRTLFEYASTTGTLKINLVFDYRQEATIRLENLGIEISDNKETYDALKAKYNSLYASYLKKKNQLDSLVAVFNSAQSFYNTSVNYWNKRGGAPKKEYDILMEQKAELDAQLNQINELKKEVKELADDVNAIVDQLNRLAYVLNLNVKNYNNIGAERGGEFEEGLYQSDENGTKIDIYEFATKKQLIRVLAHELGHALGIGHLENPAAIMYELNVGTSTKLTSDDLAALKEKCQIK